MIENLYLLFIILLSGLATSYYRSNESVILIFLVTVVLLIKNRIQISGKIKTMMAWWGVFVIIHTIAYREFHPMFSVMIPVKLLVAYFLAQKFGTKFFVKVESIIYVLSVISLFFFVWQLAHYPSIYAIFSMFDISGSIDPYHTKNLIVYSLQDNAIYDVARNCGFCWEPGPFACYLAIAIFINLARTNFNLSKNYRFWTLYLVLLTTFSTTGYAALIIIFFWIAFNNRSYRRYVFISFTAIAIISVYLYITLPFFKEKILDEYTQKDDLEELVRKSKEYQGSYAPGRFVSFMIDMQDFVRNPVIGYGGHPEARWLYHSGAEIAPIGGLGNHMAKYGLTGILVLIILLYKSSVYYRDLFGFKIPFVWSLLVLIIMFGFALAETYLLFTFLTFSYFVKNGKEFNGAKLRDPFP